MTTMKAIVQDRYGSPDVLALRDVPVPVPGDDQVLVRVRAASVNPLDWHHTTGTPWLVRLSDGLRRPKQAIRGVDYAGEVVAVGRDVTRLAPGDAVYGMRDGAFAEYVHVSGARAVGKPANVSFAQAAAIPVAGLTALQGLRDKGRIAAGQRVCVNGASGGVGPFAVQLAVWFGAEVTAVCGPRNVEAARAAGAHRVVDYTSEDFTRDRYDLILDIAGTRSLAARRRALAPGGRLVIVGGPKANRVLGPAGKMLVAVAASRFGRGTIVGFLARNDREDLELLRELVESGTVTPTVERTYPLAEAADALRYVGAGHARAKVVLEV